MRFGVWRLCSGVAALVLATSGAAALAQARDPLRAYEQEFKDQGYGAQPLWLTEFGWPGNGTPTGPYYPSTAVQAKYLK